MKERIVFYDARLITEQLNQGDKYSKINQVISIIITNKTLVEGSSRYHHRFTLFDLDVKIEFSDIIEIHTLELQKLPEEPDGTKLYDWAKFIDAETEEELNMTAERNPEVKKAAVRIVELSADERARELAENHIKHQRDMASILDGKDIEHARVIADKDAEIADNHAEIARLRALLEKQG